MRSDQRFIVVAIASFFIFAALYSSTFVVDPGTRGVLITLGKVASQIQGEGVGFKTPFAAQIVVVSVRQHSQALKAECFSSDLQQVNIDVRVLYRVPEHSVIELYKQFAGNPFDALIAPRMQEALKEVTALETAEGIVKHRESIKSRALETARGKVGNLLVLEDLVIENITLSSELEKAIESKMVQEQEAAKAKYLKQKAEIEAETAVVRADGEARAIRVRGQAIKENPGLVALQMVEKWDGHAPLVVGSSGGANILLPLDERAKRP